MKKNNHNSSIEMYKNSAFKDSIASRAINVANYICQHKTTVRETSKVFDISKSTVHKDISHRLKYLDHDLYIKVKKIVDHNLSERHLRGGIATKNKYLKQSKNT